MPPRLRPLPAVLAAILVLGCGGAPPDSGLTSEDTLETVPPGDPVLELTLETDRTTYQTGEPVELDLELRNPSEDPVTLSFSDGQRHDFRILDGEGAAVWTWSDDHSFIQVLGEETLAPGEERSWKETYPGPLPPGEYTAVGTVPATRRTLRAEATFRVR